MSQEFEVKMELDMETMRQLFGQYDTYLSKIEKQMHVLLIDRDGVLRIQGKEEAVQQVRPASLSWVF